MSGWFYLLVVVLAIVGLTFLGFKQFGYDPIAHLSCQELGNDYVAVKKTGQAMGQYYCVHRYSDADKECISSNECEGDCLVTDETVVETDGFYGKKVSGHGRCQASDQPIAGCSQGTWENPAVFCQ